MASASRSPAGTTARALRLALRRVLPLLWRAFNWTFCPEAAAKQLCVLFVLGVARLWVYKLRQAVTNVLRPEVLLLRLRGSEAAFAASQIREARKRCADYASFVALGEELDRLEGRDQWKLDPESPHYNARRLRRRVRRYQELQAEGDTAGIMFALRGELHRKHFGICNSALYEMCTTGTKQIVEQYLAAVCESLRWVAAGRDGEDDQPLARRNSGILREQVLLGSACQTGSGLQASAGCGGPCGGTGAAPAGPRAAVSPAERLAFFTETRHAFGRSALLLSGGGALGLYHFGVVKALHLHGLLPRVISGTSAGSIVCGILGTRTGEELRELWKADTRWSSAFDLNFFGGPSLSRFCREGHSLYNPDELGSNLRKNMGEYTFLEAFDRTGLIINITVSSTPGSTRFPMLLNYLTAPNVLIWSASLASCAVPGVFTARELLAKDQFGEVVPYISEGLKFRDGSMQSDLPMTRLGELFNVNNFIVSQVNPHARVLTGGGGSHSHGWRRIPGGRLAQYLKRTLKQQLTSIAAFGLGTVGRHVSPWLAPVGVAPVGLLTQEYEGDITVYNGPGLWALPRLLRNPTEEDMQRHLRDAERETWRALPQIAGACVIEFTMEEVIRQLRAEVLGAPQLPAGPLLGLAANRLPSAAELKPSLPVSLCRAISAAQCPTGGGGGSPKMAAARSLGFRTKSANLGAAMSKSRSAGAQGLRGVSSCHSMLDLVAAGAVDGADL